MPDFSYVISAKGENGPITLARKASCEPWTPESPSAGILHAACELENAELTQVKAILEWETAPAERIFMNGYQTWTYCPEYSRTDRIRGLQHIPKALLKKYSLPSYGDYPFVRYPYRKGFLQGMSWCYFRLGERFRLIASLDETPGYTLFEYCASASRLLIRRDAPGLRVNGSYPAFDLFFAEGTEREVFDAWFAALGLAKPAAGKLVGYSSWYNRYENISEADIYEDLEGGRRVLEPGDLFQVDDGYESAVGDWLEPDPVKFPHGMKPVAEAIHAAGFKAGLWLAPFGAALKSRLYREHPDWLLKNPDGTPWMAGCNWGGFCALDIDRPEVTEYLRKVFRTVLEDWGFDLVKLDFLYAAAPFASSGETRAARMTRAMKLLRELCAGKLILGCGVPVMPAFGCVDYCRISCDVTLDWDDKTYMKLVHLERPSTRHAIGNAVSRRALNGRAYGSDPDVFFLRDENMKLDRAEKTLLAENNALFGSLFLTSDNMSNYDEEKIREFKRLRHLALAAEDIRVTEENGHMYVSYRLDGEAFRYRLP